MKTPDQYFDSKVYPTGVVVQSLVTGRFYGTDGHFSVVRGERAQLMSTPDASVLRARPGNEKTTQEVKVPTVLDYLAATANAMGKLGVWLNAYNGVDARIAHFILSDPKVQASVWVDDDLGSIMPKFIVEVTSPPSILHRSVEPTVAHVILRLSRWRTP